MWVGVENFPNLGNFLAIASWSDWELFSIFFSLSHSHMHAHTLWIIQKRYLHFKIVAYPVKH